MTVVVDTHAWIWLTIQSPQLPAVAKTALATTELILVPAICLREVAMLIEKGKLEAMQGIREFFDLAFVPGRIELAALTPGIAARSSELGPGMHGDPADRLIAATALELSLPLVTRDCRMHGISGLPSVW